MTDLGTVTDATTFYDDLVAGLAALSEIVADETADTGTYKYRYASLAGVMKTVRPVLATHHLAVTQRVHTGEGELQVETIVLHQSGASWDSGVITAKMPPNAQQVGSLVSYLRRYQLVALLGIATEDDDAGATQGPTRAPQPPARQGSSRVTRPAPARQDLDPGALGDAQRRQIMALFGDLGLNGAGNRDERLRITADIVGRELKSTNEVTPREASLLIDALYDRVSRLYDQPPEEDS